MRAILTDWRTDLIKAHPRLFHARAGVPQAARGYPACGDGWRELLNSACAKIDAAISEGESFNVLQIKEKWATLRFFWRGSLSTEAEAKIVEAVTLAEARSACTCSQCGEEGRVYRAGGLLITRCSLHAKGQPVELTAGLENVHIVRRVVAGQFRGVTCSLYVRATDTFIDLLPDPPGIEVRGEISSSRREAAAHG
jgi:hypothetical protein